MDFLNNVVPKIMEHVKGGEKPPAPAVKTTRSPAKKPAATKAKPVVEEEVFPELDEEDDSSLRFLSRLNGTRRALNRKLRNVCPLSLKRL